MRKWNQLNAEVGVCGGWIVTGILLFDLDSTRPLYFGCSIRTEVDGDHYPVSAKWPPFRSPLDRRHILHTDPRDSLAVLDHGNESRSSSDLNRNRSVPLRSVRHLAWPRRLDWLEERPRSCRRTAGLVVAVGMGRMIGWHCIRCCHTRKAFADTGFGHRNLQ